MAYKQLKLWFDADLAILLSKKTEPIHPGFDSAGFIQNVKTRVDSLELKDRVEVIADELFNSLGLHYAEAIRVLLDILGPENPKETGMFKEYYWVMPIAGIVEKHGLDDFELSMRAIEEITKRNTGEYTIRPFIKKHPLKTMDVMLRWSQSSSTHVRRLASEGGRPRLPWAAKLQQLIDDPTPLLPILDNLKDDPSKYVQKSVANCLNDILKDNHAIAQANIEAWLPDATKERTWIIKHALRNLLKKEDSWATAILERI